MTHRGRALQGIAQGVGFLGAGIILQAKREVRGLTTAASLWAAAALGFCAGVGMYLLGAFGALLLYTTLRWLKPLEARIVDTPASRDVHLPPEE